MCAEKVALFCCLAFKAHPLENKFSLQNVGWINKKIGLTITAGKSIIDLRDSRSKFGKNQNMEEQYHWENCVMELQDCVKALAHYLVNRSQQPRNKEFFISGNL